MLNIDLALSNPRVCRSLTGQSPEKFEQLLVRFECCYRALANARPRQRRFGGGRKGALVDFRHKLFFILFYMKVYPTLDVAGFIWGVDRTRPHKWVKALLPVLERTLQQACLLPQRQIHSVADFLKTFPEVKDVWVDGTERPLPRPQSPKNKKRHYSGKKKAHTRKNIIACDEKKRVLLLSPTKPGRVHDKRLAEKSGVFHHLPRQVTAWADTGFQGVQHIHPKTQIPHKRKKNQPLSSAQKQENQTLASIRIIVENAIGGIKRFNCLKHPYRNRLTQGWDDTFILLATGLWNFHLAQ